MVLTGKEINEKLWHFHHEDDLCPIVQLTCVWNDCMQPSEVKPLIEKQEKCDFVPDAESKPKFDTTWTLKKTKHLHWQSMDQLYKSFKL